MKIINIIRYLKLFLHKAMSHDVYDVRKVASGGHISFGKIKMTLYF